MIKYECDSCSKIVVAAEAFGPGVWKEVPTTDMGVQWQRGKPYSYYSHDTGMQVDIIPMTQWGEQFCGECVLKTVRECVQTMQPMEVLLAEDHNDDEPSIEAILEVPESSEDSPSSDASSDVRDVRAGGELPDTSADESADPDSTTGGYHDNITGKIYVHKPDPKNPVTVQWDESTDSPDA